METEKDKEIKEMLDRLAEEQKNKQRADNIICPYCKKEQSNDASLGHITYWGEDSKTKIDCEECNKEFWVEEKVERFFETMTIEWEEKEQERIKKYIEEHK